jgi:hypothetical protein
MKIVCGMMAHNEDWVIGLTARAALLWCDELVVIAHRCKDKTVEILNEVQRETGRTVTVIEETGEFRPLNFFRMMYEARGWFGRDDHTHMVILDADELISADLVASIRKMIQHVGKHAAVEMPWIPICDSLTTMDATGPRSKHRTAFVFGAVQGQDWPLTRPGEYDLHRTRLPQHVKTLLQLSGPGGLMHLQYVDLRRQRAKEVRWKMMEMMRWPGRVTPQYLNAYYDSAVTERGEIVPVPVEYWAGYEQWMPLVRIGGESWEEKEAKRMWDMYPDRFKGLDLLGVI